MSKLGRAAAILAMPLADAVGATNDTLPNAPIAEPPPGTVIAGGKLETVPILPDPVAAPVALAWGATRVSVDGVPFARPAPLALAAGGVVLIVPVLPDALPFAVPPAPAAGAATVTTGNAPEPFAPPVACATGGTVEMMPGAPDAAAAPAPPAAGEVAVTVPMLPDPAPPVAVEAARISTATVRYRIPVAFDATESGKLVTGPAVSKETARLAPPDGATLFRCVRPGNVDVARLVLIERQPENPATHELPSAIAKANVAKVTEPVLFIVDDPPIGVAGSTPR